MRALDYLKIRVAYINVRTYDANVKAYPYAYANVIQYLALHHSSTTCITKSN